MDIRKLVGRNFARIRREKHLTQEEVEARSGFSQQYLSGLERAQPDRDDSLRTGSGARSIAYRLGNAGLRAAEVVQAREFILKEGLRKRIGFFATCPPGGGAVRPEWTS